MRGKTGSFPSLWINIELKMINMMFNMDLSLQLDYKRKKLRFHSSVLRGINNMAENRIGFGSFCTV